MVVVLVAVAGVGSRASAAVTPVPAPSPAAPGAAAPAVTAPAATVPAVPGLPPVPAVPPSITAAQDPKALLDRGVILLDAANKTTPIQPLLSTLSRTLTADLRAADQAQAAGAAADARAVAAAATASVQRANATSLQSALRQATLSLYMNGSPPHVSLGNLKGGDDMAAALAGMQLALSPTGILAARHQAVAAADAATNEARSAQAAAHEAAARAEQAYTAASAQSLQLQTQAATLASAGAAALTAEKTLLATQSSQAQGGADPLQFAPKGPLPPPVATAAVALDWAFSELGKPEVSGATGPNRFDCAGLTQFVWSKASVATPGSAAGQESWSVPIPLSELLPGDLVFFGTTDVQHEGLYIGGGLMINANHTGAVVRISPVFSPQLIGFGRAHGPELAVPPHGLSASPTPPSCTTLSSGVALPLPLQYLHGGSIDDGVDYDAPGGTPLFAMGSGTIIEEGVSGFGPNCPVLQITSGPLTGRTVYYGHAGPDLVPVGSHVVVGQQISEVGSGIVGISTGPHLEVGFYPPIQNGGGPMLDLLNQVAAAKAGP